MGGEVADGLSGAVVFGAGSAMALPMTTLKIPAMASSAAVFLVRTTDLGLGPRTTKTSPSVNAASPPMVKAPAAPEEAAATTISTAIPAHLSRLEALRSFGGTKGCG